MKVVRNKNFKGRVRKVPDKDLLDLGYGYESKDSIRKIFGRKTTKLKAKIAEDLWIDKSEILSNMSPDKTHCDSPISPMSPFKIRFHAPSMGNSPNNKGRLLRKSRSGVSKFINEEPVPLTLKVETVSGFLDSPKSGRRSAFKRSLSRDRAEQIDEVCESENGSKLALSPSGKTDSFDAVMSRVVTNDMCSNRSISVIST